jgi:putative tryptophan/tyrosine transport system substrate-binding protein
MRRRDFIAALGGSSAWSLMAGAQPARIYRILWLSTASDPDPLLDRFRDGLLSNGLVEGQHVVLEIRYASDSAGLQRTIAELPRSGFDLVVSRGAQAIQGRV